MKAGNRLLAIVGSALVVGGVGNFMAGPAPAAVAAVAPVDAGWTAPGGNAPDLAAAARVWEERGPWGMAPKPVETVVAEAVVPDPLPVGVVGAGKDRRAVFLVAGEGPRTFAPGEELPGGGRVTGVGERNVAWTDAKGEARKRQLFLDVVADASPVAYAAAEAMAPGPVPGPGGSRTPAHAPAPLAAASAAPMVPATVAGATVSGARPAQAAAASAARESRARATSGSSSARGSRDRGATRAGGHETGGHATARSARASGQQPVRGERTR